MTTSGQGFVKHGYEGGKTRRLTICNSGIMSEPFPLLPILSLGLKVHLPTARACQKRTSWLKETQTASFLVILHDSLVAEEYLMGHDEETLTNSFSMAKSITAMAVGLAVDEGLVELDASVGTYIDRLGDGASADLTVEQLLQMRSCIPFGESCKNPFGFQAKAYYRDDNRELLQGYEVEGTPGTAFKYQEETQCFWPKCWTRFVMAI